MLLPSVPSKFLSNNFTGVKLPCHSVRPCFQNVTFEVGFYSSLKGLVTQVNSIW